jgi:hypothetical protein
MSDDAFLCSGEKERHMPWKNRRPARVWNLFFLVMSFTLAGCRWTSMSAQVRFSPDSALVGFCFAKCWDLPLPPEMPTVRSTAFVRWCRTARPDECRTMKIGSFGKNYGYWVVDQITPVFSPDSRHVAVVGPRGLFLADTASGAAIRVSPDDEEVKAAGWVGSDEIVYAAHTTRQDRGATLTDLVFWQWKIAAGPGRRVELHRHPGIYSGYPREYWSPDGKRVIFVDQAYYSGQYLLLDVATGKVTPLGSPGIMSKGAAWKPDGTAAVIISQRKGDPPVEVLLIEPATGKTTDLSREFFTAFGDKVPDIDPLWTAEGKYLVVNTAELGGCLVRPDPWEVIPVSKRFIERRYPGGAPPGEAPPWIYRQPAPGWVRIWVTGGKGQSEQYAVDYQGKAYFTIGASSTPGGGWTLTPDAAGAVRLDDSAGIEVQEVKLP